MLRVALIGIGKMGLSHLSMIRTHPDVDLVGVCDTSKFMLNLLEKNANLPVFSSFESMLNNVKPEAVIVATPSSHHDTFVRMCLERGIHVFCEKPFSLDPKTSRELAQLAEQRGLVNQVGYHYRFVAAFEEMKRLLDAGAIGKVTHVLAEAYGPVVLRPKGISWRTQKAEGGGCLYDYAAHPINLLNWYFGKTTAVAGSTIKGIFSKSTDDEVYGTLYFSEGMSAQISVNWSDESYRKMTVKLTAMGTQGRIYADRQECQVYLRESTKIPAGYTAGWNVRYTTDLTQPVWFYVRGEEYSAQLAYFVRCIRQGNRDNVNSFSSASETDATIAMMRLDAEYAGQGPRTKNDPTAERERRFFRR